MSRDGTKIAYWTSGTGRRWCSSTARRPTTLDGDPCSRSSSSTSRYTQSTVEAEAPARMLRSTTWNESTRTLRPSWMPWRQHAGTARISTAIRTGGIVAFGAAALTANVRRLVLYEGWPVPDPSVYALPADVMKRMDQLLAEGDLDGVVAALFRSVEDVRMRTWPL